MYTYRKNLENVRPVFWNLYCGELAIRHAFIRIEIVPNEGYTKKSKPDRDCHCKWN